ncbi:MAG: hypothetical protein QXL94_01515, partial [Candidatus Parvarchaeum sp.]
INGFDYRGARDAIRQYFRLKMVNEYPDFLRNVFNVVGTFTYGKDSYFANTILFSPRLKSGYNWGCAYTKGVDRLGKKTLVTLDSEKNLIFDTISVVKQTGYDALISYFEDVPNKEMFNIILKRYKKITFNTEERYYFPASFGKAYKRYKAARRRAAMKYIDQVDKTDNTIIRLNNYILNMSNTTFPFEFGEYGPFLFFVGSEGKGRITITEKGVKGSYTLKLRSGGYELKDVGANVKTIKEFLMEGVKPEVKKKW